MGRKEDSFKVIYLDHFSETYNQGLNVAKIGLWLVVAVRKIILYQQSQQKWTFDHGGMPRREFVVMPGPTQLGRAMF